MLTSAYYDLLFGVDGTEMFYNCVVALCCAAVKYDLFGACADERSNMLACCFDLAAPFTPEAMDGGGIVWLMHDFYHRFGGDG